VNYCHVKHAQVEEVEGGAEQQHAPELDLLQSQQNLLASVTLHLSVQGLKVVTDLSIVHSLSSHEDQHPFQEG